MMDVDDNNDGNLNVSNDGSHGGGDAGDDEAHRTRATSTPSTGVVSASSDDEIKQQQRQQERRNSIRSIMADETMTPLEKRRTIQSLMDGRSQASRRGSMGVSSVTSRRGSMGVCSVPSRRGSMASQSSFSSFDSTGFLPPHPSSSSQQHQHQQQYQDSFSSPGRGRPSDVVMMMIPQSSSATSPSHLPPPTHVGGGTNHSIDDYRGYYGYDVSGIGEDGSTHASTNTSSPRQSQEYQQDSVPLSGGGSGAAGGSFRKPKPRSTSMPLWSDAAPIVAGSNGGGGIAGPAGQQSTDGNSYSIWDDPLMVNQRMEKSRPPCPHYERNCTIVSPCCGMAFGCRICHDECPVLPMPFVRRPDMSAGAAECMECPSSPNTKSTSMTNATTDSATVSTAGLTLTLDEQEAAIQEHHQATSRIQSSQTSQTQSLDRRNVSLDQPKAGATTTTAMPTTLGIKQKQDRRFSLPLSYYDDDMETHHEIDRFAISEVICRLCYTRQSSKRNFCITCNTQFGAYHCSLCNLWMSDEEEPYHCDKCGFCRVGGRENFRHCDDCGMCIDVNLFDDHNCKAGKYMSNCPVCQEDLFSSRDASHEMPCGHAIHWHCFKELTSYDTRCPICKKTAETPEHMASTWHAMSVGISLQPVPPELARVVTITCNDCEETDTDRRWHFLGVRCNHCGSFNTTVDRTSLTGREAALYLDEMDQLRGVDPPTNGDVDEEEMQD